MEALSEARWDGVGTFATLGVTGWVGLRDVRCDGVGTFRGARCDRVGIFRGVRYNRVYMAARRPVLTG